MGLPVQAVPGHPKLDVTGGNLPRRWLERSSHVGAFFNMDVDVGESLTTMMKLTEMASRFKQNFSSATRSPCSVMERNGDKCPKSRMKIS